MPNKKKSETTVVAIPKALLDRIVQGLITQDEADAVCRSLKEGGLSPVPTDG
jgi:hypothetical protein